MGVTVANISWLNVDRTQFIDQIVKNSNLLSTFTLVDGVKSKVSIPVYDASIVWQQDKCTFDPQSTASIDEKEMTVEEWNWAFVNCKQTLENTYRSVLLRQGQLNEETLDAEFESWLMTYFGKKVQEKVMLQAATELIDAIENGPDAGDVVPFTISAVTSSTILDNLEAGYLAMEGDLLDAMHGAADREYMPTIYMNAKAVQAYQIAIAGLYTQSPQGIEEGRIPPYFGMNIQLFSSLPDDHIIITYPANLVMLTDDYNDTNAIDSEYVRKTHSLHLFGAFKLGFNFKNAAHLLYGTVEA